jgi:thiamine pyrophosphokinase
MRALIVLAGSVPERADLDRAWPGWSDGLELTIAADAGAETAERLGLRPDLAVGDFDSIDPAALARLEAAGVPIELSPAAKDESDAELAVRAALARGADALTIVGGFGGRPDHFIANIGLLGLPELSGLSVELVDGSTRLSLVRGPGARLLIGRPGDLVSLLPLGVGIEGVTSEGLAWPLTDEPLPLGPARGLSNVRQGGTARVSVRAGLLLVVETVAGPPAGAASASSARLRP